MAEDTQITVGLGDTEHLQQQIIEEAANQLLRRWTAAGPEGEQSQVPTALARRLEEEIVSRIEAEAAEVAPKVAEQILAEGVQRRDAYGSARGEVVPLRTIVGEEVTRQLSRGNSVGRSEKGVLEQMVGREVERVLRKELTEAMEEAKNKVAEAVRAEAAQLLADAMKRAADRAGVSI